MPVLFALCAALAAVLCARVALQFYQLESYQFGGYFRALKRNWLRAFLPGIAAAAAGCLGALAAMWASPLAMLAVAAAAYVWQRRLKAKKPLVFTARVKRLLAFLLLVAALLAALIVRAFKALPFLLFEPALAPLVLALAALAALPLEKLIQRLYLRDAQKRLKARPDLIKIGITGSYGKTSAKYMLQAVLSEKYRVLITPGSFNTSMGVTRIIRERLMPDHQVFVAEMGARHLGDIRLLCKLVKPRYGMLTSVGPQHLETFHTQENICREKFELARAIPADGAMVFASDGGGLCEALYRKCTCPKHLSGETHEGLGLYAKDIEVGPWGSRFLLCDGKEEVPCQTRLLGAHNIGNLLLACTMGRVLGMDLETIARGAGKAQPVEHRLQLLTTPGGVTIIDDAFNANPVGADAALEVIRSFTGRKIVVTPGFVEMGEREAECNRTLGEHLAEVADIVVLVGRRHTAPIAEGLRAKGFAEERLHIVATLDESTVWLSGVLRAGDVLLYENDLPDNYQ